MARHFVVVNFLRHHRLALLAATRREVAHGLRWGGPLAPLPIAFTGGPSDGPVPRPFALDAGG